jgi:hypothetical protein
MVWNMVNGDGQRNNLMKDGKYFRRVSMTDEQQELYDIVSDWWDDVFVAASFKGRDASLVDLVNAIIEWKDKPQQYPVEGFE